MLGGILIWFDLRLSLILNIYISEDLENSYLLQVVADLLLRVDGLLLVQLLETGVTSIEYLFWRSIHKSDRLLSEYDKCALNIEEYGL